MIRVYGRENCNYCRLAKELLDRTGINYAYSTVGEDIGINEIKEMYPAARTVPIVEVNGKWIGGYNELKQYIEESRNADGNAF
jgi:glutaredoxin